MIRVLDNKGSTADRFTIIIDNDLWFMSDNANMPNGVCIYGGSLQDYSIEDSGIEIELEDLPEGTAKQLDYILLNLMG